VGAFVRLVAEESFDHVEPTAARERVVKMKALMARCPALNRRVLVGGIVVDDKVFLFMTHYNIAQP
jgi:hypothetical protein